MGYKYYNYDPNFGAAAVFIILFGVSSLTHLFQIFKNKTWYFIPFIIGGACEHAPVHITKYGLLREYS